MKSINYQLYKKWDLIKSLFINHLITLKSLSLSLSLSHSPCCKTSLQNFSRVCWHLKAKGKYCIWIVTQYKHSTLVLGAYCQLNMKSLTISVSAFHLLTLIAIGLQYPPGKFLFDQTFFQQIFSINGFRLLCMVLQQWFLGSISVVPIPQCSLLDVSLLKRAKQFRFHCICSI